MQKLFQSIPHTADIHIRVYGQTIEELFRNALKEMFLSIGSVVNSKTISIYTIPSLDKKHVIAVKASSKQLLLNEASLMYILLNSLNLTSLQRLRESKLISLK